MKFICVECQEEMKEVKPFYFECPSCERVMKLEEED